MTDAAMSDPHAAFLAAIRADPADDLPRLVYADWLDEHTGLVECGCHYATVTEREAASDAARRILNLSEYEYNPKTRLLHHRRCQGMGLVSNHFAERAEFIRVQVELAKSNSCLVATVDDGFGPHPCRCRWHELRRRGRELWPMLRESFRSSLPGSWAVHSAPLIAEPIPEQNSVVVRRGFVAEVRCPLAAWVGRGCWNCGGLGHHHRDDSLPSEAVRQTHPELICVRCFGTGRIPGIGPRVVAAHPIEVVTLADSDPHEDGGEWQWVSARNMADWRVDVHREVLPMEVAKHLKGGRYYAETRSIVAQWWYPTREAALAARSAALIAHAKGIRK